MAGLRSPLRRRRRPFVSSIRLRYTIVVGVLFTVILSGVGTLISLGIRNTVASDLTEDMRLTILDWVTEMRPGHISSPKPTARAKYLQLVDSKGRVVASNAAAAGKPPLSTARPSPSDRLLDGKACPPWESGRCLLITVLRMDDGAASTLFGGEPHFVYAGTTEPPALAMRYLEAGIVAAVLFASATAAWSTWVVVGRTLQPVRAISTKMRAAAESDLHLRIPEPPGDDEIAEFARTSNVYLDRLEKAVKAQRRFASMASHELRSPVAALRTQLEEALLYPEDTDARVALRRTLCSTERLEAIIDDLLAYTRIKGAPPAAYEPLDLADLVEFEIAALPRDGAEIRLRVVDRPIVLGSRIQLGRVLTNLLANARRHARSRIDVTVEQDGGHAVVSVRDDGAGIAPEDRERVFDAFVRLREAQRLDPGGTGLGLAISRETCHAHGGSLTVADDPAGTRFVLRLPVPAPADECPG
ncbi:signal transduction histidine kinase [Nonomuraea fuscirosea]|uniref:histidine kinase n=1 Tax=Nonomuraea fuscirosea TaxID=1291556 RepID=A0A2T0N7V1_9ACTN|nr:signal transduction histidine kinase [Nonomuraea fuscirosea]